MIKLWDFQARCVQQLEGLNSAVLVAPTGSGKTMMGAAIAWKEAKKGNRVAFVVPRDNLARQTKGTMERWGLTVGMILGGCEENRIADIQVISYQSLGSKKRDLSWMSANSWIIDECHITAFAQALEEPMRVATRKIGLTATPWQMGGKRSLLEIFDYPVFAPSVGELIGKGYLAKPIYLAPKKTGKLKPTPDFIYEQWEEHAYGEKTFVFGNSIEESDEIAKYFEEKGIPAASVTSRTTAKDTERAFELFKQGKILVLCSCYKLAEGCDIPSATCVVLAQRTESRSRYVQCIGRGARSHPGKMYFKVIDCVKAISRHGKFHEIKIGMEDFLLGDLEKTGQAPTKQCPNCFGWNHAAARICKTLWCQHSFELIGSVYHSPGQLQRECDSPQEEIAIATFHSMLLADFRQNTTSAVKGFYSKYNYYPLQDWIEGARLPGYLRSPSSSREWRYFLGQVRDQIPKYAQLKLPL